MKKSRLSTMPRPTAAHRRNTSEHARGIGFGAGPTGNAIVFFSVITPPAGRSDTVIVVDPSSVRQVIGAAGRPYPWPAGSTGSRAARHRRENPSGTEEGGTPARRPAYRRGRGRPRPVKDFRTCHPGP